MAVDGDIIRRLAALDMPAECLREVMSIIADISMADDERKRKDRDRKRNKRGGNSEESPRNVHGLSEENPPGRLPQRDINQTPSTPPSEPDGSSVDVAPRRSDLLSILSAVLPADVAAEVIAHRKAIGSKLSAGSARGLAKAFAATSDPVDAARTMMARGWRGFQPEWLDNASARAGPAPPPKKRGYFDIAREAAADDHRDRQTGFANYRPPYADAADDEIWSGSAPPANPPRGERSLFDDSGSQRHAAPRIVASQG